MKSITIQKSVTEKIKGIVERVTFHSEESGFCVLRLQVKGKRDLLTITGVLASISAGEHIECEGQWVNDKKHGLQFKANQLMVTAPTTLEGIEKYLGSGMVKGIGPHFAKKLVKAFGTDVFDVIEQQPHKLMSLEGIGEKRKNAVISAWAEQKSIRDIMIFLQSYGVGTSRAVRIYKMYGDEAISLVRANPYRLAMDIRGIGFKTADDLAQRLGIPRDSSMRAQAGVNHVLQQLCDHGHCAAEHDKLVSASIELLEIEDSLIQKAIVQELTETHIVADLINEIPCVFPAMFYHAEVGVAKLLGQLQQGTPAWGNIDTDKAIPWAEQITRLQLSSSQQQAIKTVLQNKVTILTGGPGVGKTTIVKTLITILRVKKMTIGLCAPTGRAAKRLSETTGLIAKTIHRLLEFDPKNYAFKHNQDHPLKLDMLVVDEASMLDIILFYQLIKAVPKHAALLFVGDIDQLPSVGSGAVLTDLIQSNTIATVRLQEIFRQAAHSQIIINAHRINQGNMPLHTADSISDFYTIYRETPEAIHDTIVELMTQRIPKRFGYHAIHDIQLLTPMNRGGLGSIALNATLQQRLNGDAQPKINRFGWTFSPGDKVIQTTNNYDKEVFNGDIGRIHSIDLEEGQLKIDFDGRLLLYELNELDEINLAYAISIHKSQGSEFPVIVMPVAMQHYTLLARNLLYTGVTRGKKLVVLVGQKKAIAMAIHNNRESQRLTKLKQRLQM